MKQWCMAVWTVPKTSSPAFHTMRLFQFQNQFHPEKEWFMKKYGRFCGPAAGSLKHAVVLSYSNLECKLGAQAAKLHFLFWKGPTQLCKVLLCLSPCLTRAPAPCWLYDGCSELLNREPPVLLLFPTVTINLCNGVQSVHDLITYFINWGSITLSQRYNYLCSDAGMFL